MSLQTHPGRWKQNTKTPSSHQWTARVTASYKGPEDGACTHSCLQGGEVPAAPAEQQGAVLSGTSRPGHSPPDPGGLWPESASVSPAVKREVQAHRLTGFSRDASSSPHSLRPQPLTPHPGRLGNHVHSQGRDT